MILISQASSGGSPNGQAPTYVPDTPQLLPKFDVSLQAPLPPSADFNGALYNFVSPPLFAFLAPIMSITIAKMIIRAFNKK
jgi:hypothetical protein